MLAHPGLQVLVQFILVIDEQGRYASNASKFLEGNIKEASQEAKEKYGLGP